jgi:hypothetical protein
MVKVNVDFSDVESFEAIPEGEYPVIINEVTYVEPASDDKYPYLNVELEITEGEHEGRKLWTIWSFSPKALWRMKQVFENLGLPVDEVEFEVDEDTDAVTDPELVGLPAIAVVTIEPYEGKDRNRVDNLISSDTPASGSKKKNGKADTPKGAKAKAAAGPAKKSGRKFK